MAPHYAFSALPRFKLTAALENNKGLRSEGQRLNEEPLKRKRNKVEATTEDENARGDIFDNSYDAKTKILIKFQIIP